jgi:hypothetical protein
MFHGRSALLYSAVLPGSSAGNPKRYAIGSQQFKYRAYLNAPQQMSMDGFASGRYVFITLS